MDEIFFLVSLNEDNGGEPVNYVTNHDQWRQMLVTARANGWEPQGTILDYEFHYQLEVSKYENIGRALEGVLDRQVKDRCARWQGGYLSPEYQVVTHEDARGLRKALRRTDVSLDLLLFFSRGAFRIAG